METLFELPKPVRTKKPRLDWTQQERCKRCSGSVSDATGAYCHRLDLCLEFHKGHVYFSKDGQPMTCDGKSAKHKQQQQEGGRSDV